MQTEQAKPSYLGLLNAISLAETEAGVYLRAWANATCDEELACTLRLVALRERHHGEAFCRRLCELGYDLRHKNDPKSSERLLKYADPKIADVDKLPPEKELDDPFGEIERQLAAGVFDPLTCNMLTWYIAEERDSGRRLREAYARVRAKCAEQMARASAPANGASDGPAQGGPSADAQAIMACMSEGFARLEQTLARFATMQ